MWEDIKCYSGSNEIMLNRQQPTVTNIRRLSWQQIRTAHHRKRLSISKEQKTTSIDKRYISPRSRTTTTNTLTNRHQHTHTHTHTLRNKYNFSFSRNLYFAIKFKQRLWICGSWQYIFFIRSMTVDYYEGQSGNSKSQDS